MPELEICHLDLVLEGISSEMQNKETLLNLNQGVFRRTPPCLPAEVQRGWPDSFWWVA